MLEVNKRKNTRLASWRLKKRLKKQGIKNQLQFQILREITNYAVENNTVGKWMFIELQKLRGIIGCSQFSFPAYFNDLDVKGFLKYTRLKPGCGEPTKDKQEYAIKVNEKAVPIVQKECRLMARIQEANRKLMQEFEDFEF